MEKSNLYGMLAKYYEHIDPDKHIHYYKKHFYHEQKWLNITKWEGNTWSPLIPATCVMNINEYERKSPLNKGIF